MLKVKEKHNLMELINLSRAEVISFIDMDEGIIDVNDIIDDYRVNMAK